MVLGLYESGSGDMATLGGLANSGTVEVDHGSTLQINGAVTNSGSLTTGDYLGGNTLTITGGLTNSGSFGLDASGDSASMQTLVNTGTVGVVTGASLNLTNQPGGITDVVAGSVFSIAGSFTAGANSAFANLTSIEGQVTLYGQNDTITPNGGTLTLASGGSLFADNGSTVTINGAVNNSGTLYTGFEANGGNTLTITGTLTNQASGQLILGLYESGSGDMATLGGLANSGTVEVDHGSTLQINGAVTNSGSLTTGSYLGGNTLRFNGNLTNNAGATFALGAASDVAIISYVTNAGVVSLASGSTLNVTGGSHAAVNALPGFLNSGTVNIAQGATLADPLNYVQTGDKPNHG